MASQDIRSQTFGNGLTLVLEPMPNVQSAAFTLLVPAGSLYDPPGRSGTAAALCDLITRGAGSRDSQQLSDALDDLGLQRSESVGTNHLAFTGATLATKLPEALAIYADVVRRPHLPEDELEAVLSGIELSLRAIEDDPAQKLMPELRRRCYDAPWGLPTDGALEDLPAIDVETVRRHAANCVRPGGAILGIAGRIDAERIADLVAEAFGDWTGGGEPAIATTPCPRGTSHIEFASTQTHIGVAWDSVPYADPEYYEAWGAVSVLCGGSSSRLFTEVREKRGLCYAVSASHHGFRETARVLCYVGTERPQETLDVTLREVVRLGEGFGADELDRARARAKSGLVMQQESTSARSTSIARDWFHLGRVTTLDEVRAKVDALTVDSILAHWHAHPPRDFVTLAIGPEPVETPRELA